MRWLRISYVTGAIVDGLAGIALLIPARMAETEFRLAMGIGAALMFGWTALLLWANFKPVERKGVLLLTIFPVITGILATVVWAGVTGFFPWARAAPTIVMLVGLIVLLGFSYWQADQVRSPGHGSR